MRRGRQPNYSQYHLQKFKEAFHLACYYHSTKFCDLIWRQEHTYLTVLHTSCCNAAEDFPRAWRLWWMIEWKWSRSQSSKSMPPSCVRQLSTVVFLKCFRWQHHHKFAILNNILYLSFLCAIQKTSHGRFSKLQFSFNLNKISCSIWTREEEASASFYNSWSIKEDIWMANQHKKKSKLFFIRMVRVMMMMPLTLLLRSITSSSIEMSLCMSCISAHDNMTIQWYEDMMISW